MKLPIQRRGQDIISQPQMQRIKRAEILPLLGYSKDELDIFVPEPVRSRLVGNTQMSEVYAGVNGVLNFTAGFGIPTKEGEINNVLGFAKHFADPKYADDYRFAPGFPLVREYRELLKLPEGETQRAAAFKALLKAKEVERSGAWDPKWLRAYVNTQPSVKPSGASVNQPLT